MDELTVRDEREWRKFVREALDTIKERQRETQGLVNQIVFRLDTLNGSVSRHETAIGELRIKQSTDETAEATRKAVSKEWWDRLKPIVYLLLGYLFALIMKNGPDLLKFGGH